MMHYLSVWIVLLALNGSAALAQTTQPVRSAKEGAAEQTSSTDLLAGPKVDDDAARETDPQFGGAGRDRSRISVPPRQWFGLLRTLDLDEDQVPEVRRLVQSFQKAARAHQQANGQRLRELQGQVREARGAGRDVPAEVRRELGKLRSLAPKPAAYQAKIWSVLTETQQETMRAGLAQIRQRIAERRAAERRTDVPAMSSDRPPRSDAMSQTDLDDRARRRLRFLRSRQSPPGRPGDAKD
jgi:hypothetical protein